MDTLRNPKFILKYQKSLQYSFVLKFKCTLILQIGGPSMGGFMVIIHQHIVIMPHTLLLIWWKVKFILAVWLEYTYLIICTSSENILESYWFFQKDNT